MNVLGTEEFCFQLQICCRSPHLPMAYVTLGPHLLTQSLPITLVLDCFFMELSRRPN
jgi:hypothetical protein